MGLIKALIYASAIKLIANRFIYFKSYKVENITYKLFTKNLCLGYYKDIDVPRSVKKSRTFGNWGGKITNVFF